MKKINSLVNDNENDVLAPSKRSVWAYLINALSEVGLFLITMVGLLFVMILIVFALSGVSS